MTTGYIHTAFRISLLLIGLAGFMAPTGLYAEEKTPPFYSKEEAKDSVGKTKSASPAPAKDLSTLFSRPTPASTDTATVPISDEVLQTQEYVVKEGDWIAKILREKGLTDSHNLPELLVLLRKLNASLHDLDMIQPGEKIVILVKVVPDEGAAEKTSSPKLHDEAAAEKTPPARLHYDTYRVQRGDILSRLAMQRYSISEETFAGKYMKLFTACNPSIKDPDHLVSGRVIRLPHYPQPDGEMQKQPSVLRDLGKTPHRIALRPKTDLEPPPPVKPSPAPQPKTPPTVAKPAAPESSHKPVSGETTPPPSPWPAHLKPVMPEAPPIPTLQATPETPQPVAVEPAVAEVDQTTSPGSWPSHVRPVTSESFDGRVVGRTVGSSSPVIIADGLETVITKMGEEWTRAGEHVIPMRSGGHIQLDAQSYPMVRFRDGITLIVDLNDSLPPKMGRVIESTWANYRVVRLSANDDLRSALDKIVDALKYPRAVEKGKPLTLGGAIPVSISGDWIVTLPPTVKDKGPRYVVINILDRGRRGLPAALKTYLKGLGVEIIEYPSIEPDGKESTTPVEVRMAGNPTELVRAILDLMGIPFKTQVSLSAFKTSNQDFRFTVLADFYLEMEGRRYVIDVTGMGPDVVSLLNENGISALSLGHEKEPAAMTSGVLDLLGVPFEDGPCTIAANPGNVSNQVAVTLSGITFIDRKGTPVLATPLHLPAELATFLAQKGYAVLVMSPSAPPRSGKALGALPAAGTEGRSEGPKGL